MAIFALHFPNLVPAFVRRVWRGLRPAVHGRHQAKFTPPHEDRMRKLTAWACGLATLWFLALTVWNVLHRTALVPVPWGSGVLVELALSFWPGVWWVAAIHNGCLMFVFATLWASSTVWHAALPGHPASPCVVIRRRQVPFFMPSVLVALALLYAGIWVAAQGHPTIARVVESVAVGFAIRAAALGLIPRMSMYLTAEIDNDGGVGNRLTVGGGRRWRQGPQRCFHEKFDRAEVISGFVESCFGLATLRLILIEEDGGRRAIDIPNFGSLDLAEQSAYWFNGPYKLGRTFKAKDATGGFTNRVYTIAVPPGAPHP